MIEATRDPMVVAATRLEAAVERLADRLTEVLSRTRPAEQAEMVPQAEVLALAERLDDAIARLRVAVAEELRGGAAEEPPGEGEEE
jgi:hypothetical protein